MFPRTNSIKTCICIAGTQGLISAKRDAVSIGTVMSRLGFDILVVIDNQRDMLWIKERLPRAKFTSSINDVMTELNQISESSQPNDVFISISAHGYVSGKANNYFIFNGSKINRQLMRKWYTNLEYDRYKVITLIDTCHSENMVGYQNNYNFEHMSNNIAIAGCSQRQSLMEDISDEFGYGGGLTSAFLDAIGQNQPFDVNLMIKSCSLRISKLGVTTIVTSTTNRVSQSSIEDFPFDYNPLIQSQHQKKDSWRKNLLGFFWLLNTLLSLQLTDFDPVNSLISPLLLLSIGLHQNQTINLICWFISLVNKLLMVTNIRILTYIGLKIEQSISNLQYQ